MRRPYLEQRHVAAVLYLNTGGGADFTGGVLQFQSPESEEPVGVQPAAGRLVGPRGRSLSPAVLVSTPPVVLSMDLSESGTFEGSF